MKKTVFILAVSALLAGCGDGGHIERQNSVEDVLKQNMAIEDGLNTTEISTAETEVETTEFQSEIQAETEAETPKTEETTAAAVPQTAAEPEPSGEITDLTVLNSDMVYAVVFEMMTDPQKYYGKTIKMSGTASRYTDVETGADYYACIITDAQACCAQGIEYKLPEGENYPEYGSNITVMGVFGSYTEDGNEFYVLNDAKILE
ncbi:MAG: hypothetical protein IJR59_04825 [Firmicutes bacterium]|nr:hypothetical protein [Bacillota bacterium]